MKKTSSKISKPKAASPAPYTRLGVAIVHRKYGEFWSPRIFNNEVEAREFFDGFWQTGFKEGSAPPFSDYIVVPAKQTTSFVKPRHTTDTGREK